MEQRLVTIVFIDMQGYTKRSAAQTVEEMKRFHDEFHGFVKDHLDRHGGLMVKSLGDGFLCRFDAPTKAVACALEMQRKLQARNEDMLNPDKIVRFRIGVNTGEVGIDETGDLFGDPVNIAARIQGFAEPNGVFISEATYLAMNRNEFGAQDLGPQQFKNATREIKVYKVLPRGEAAVAAAQARAKVQEGARGAGVGRKVAIAAAILLALLVVGNIARKARLGRAARDAAELSKRAAAPLPGGHDAPPGGGPSGMHQPGMHQPGMPPPPGGFPGEAGRPGPAPHPGQAPPHPGAPHDPDDPLADLMPPPPPPGETGVAAPPPEEVRRMLEAVNQVRSLAREGKFDEAIRLAEEHEAGARDFLRAHPLAAKRFLGAKATLLEKAGRTKEAGAARALAESIHGGEAERPGRRDRPAGPLQRFRRERGGGTDGDGSR